MFKRLLLFLLCLFVVIPTTDSEARPIRVGVLPFAVHSQEDLGYLAQGIQDMLNSHLLQRGVDALPPSEISELLKDTKPSGITEKKAMEIGQSLSVDFVIFGSLTKVGQNISLDAKVVDVSGVQQTSSVIAQAVDLENLNVATEQLAGDLTMKVSGRKKISKIVISGNKRIETDAIKRVLQSREGDIYSEVTAAGDLKRVYGMEFFDDVKIDVSDTPKGKEIQFIVEEKPIIQRVEFSGNRMIEQEDLVEVLGYNLYSILNPKKIVESVENMRNLYREKGYYNAEISYKLEPIDAKKVAIVYDITEGRRVYIIKIQFTGNDSYSARKLKWKMKTSEKNFLSWVLDTGILNKETLKTDTVRLSSFYYNNGYIRAKVGDPKIDVEEKGLVVTIPIVEGPRFTIGTIFIEGDLVEPAEEILEKLETKPGAVFNRDNVRKDVQTITALTADKGYAFADVAPKVKENEEDLTVDLTFVVDKKKLVSFERISITGNDKTRDKVIRRELRVKEGDLFSAEGLRKSNINLQRLNYFEEVEIATNKGSEEDKMNLEVKVKEKSTGAFSFGAGYSSFNKVFGTASVAENNLFGRGQQISLEASIGQRATQYQFSFTEPWLFDIPLAAGFDVFRTDMDYDEFDKQATGFAVRGSYPLREYVYLSSRYRYESIYISDIEPTASNVIKEMSGRSSTSSILARLGRDNRNAYFNPTEGSDNSISVEYAGGPLGGTNAFTRVIGESGWYIPLWWDESAFHVRGKAGYVVKGPGDLPTYEKFYLGGIDSIRGFQWGDISPKDPVSGDKIGGETMALLNLEVIFPLFKEVGLLGVVFMDHGNVWTKNNAFDFAELKRSYGGGFRYNSPFGPIRLEYGRVINPKPGEPTGNWEFAVGGSF